MDEVRRIPPFAKDALAVLNDAVGDTNDGLPKSEAEALLADNDRSQRLTLSTPSTCCRIEDTSIMSTSTYASLPPTDSNKRTL